MVVILKPTLNCNIRCRHCFVGDKRLSHQWMTAEDADTLLRKLPSRSEVIFHGGEPFLMGTDFYSALLGTGDRTQKFSIQTNLTLFDDSWIPVIADQFQGRISTSFDYGASLRPVETARWMESIERLKSAGVYPYVVSMLWRGNEHMGHEMYDFFSSRGLSFRINAVENLGYATGEFPLLRHSGRSYAEAVISIFDRWFMSPDAEILVDPCAEILAFFLLNTSFLKCPFTSRCGSHFISINPDGTVFPCSGFDNLPIAPYGNLFTDQLEDILLSPARLAAQRRSFQLPESCYSCQYLAICNGGCRLEAMSYYGRADRETSLCGDYLKIFGHMERRIREESGDIADWFYALYNRREALCGQ